MKFVLIVTTTSVPKYKGFWLCPGHEHSLFWNGVSSIYQCLRPRLVGLWPAPAAALRALQQEARVVWNRVKRGLSELEAQFTCIYYYG